MKRLFSSLPPSWSGGAMAVSGMRLYDRIYKSIRCVSPPYLHSSTFKDIKQLSTAIAEAMF